MPRAAAKKSPPHAHAKAIADRQRLLMRMEVELAASDVERRGKYPRSLRQKFVFARVRDEGFFARDVKAVPTTPTHCRCGVELEPLRRYAGLCKRCVARWMKRRAKRVRPAMRVVRRFERDGVRYVEVRCTCSKRRRTMREATYDAQRPETCNRCRLREVDRNGFEAEHPR
jgi:hypothetical protein